MKKRKDDLHKNGTLIYKCRRCGERVCNTDVPDIDAAVILITMGQKFPEEWGTSERLTSFHTCPDGEIGVTDLIGGEREK